MMCTCLLSCTQLLKKLICICKHYSLVISISTSLDNTVHKTDQMSRPSFDKGYILHVIMHSSGIIFTKSIYNYIIIVCT